MAALLASFALLLVLAPSASADFGFLRQFGSETVPQSDPNYLFNPDGIAVASTPDHKVYVGSQTGRITSFNNDGSGATVVVPETSPLVGEGDGIAEADGKLYIADTTGSRVVVLSTGGGLQLMWGWGVRDGSNEFQTCTTGCRDGIPGFGDGQLNYPAAIAVDPAAGHVYVADDRNHRIAKFTTAGAFVKNIGKNNGDGTRGTADGEFTNPTGVAIRGGTLYVSEQGSISWTGGHRMQKLSPDGSPVATWGSQGSGDGQFNFPDDIAVDSQGNSWVIEPAPNARVQVFGLQNQFLAKLQETGDRYFSGHGLAIDADDNVYILDGEGGRVLVYGQREEPPPGRTCPPAPAAAFARPLGPVVAQSAPVNEVRVVRLKPAAEVRPAGCRFWAQLAEGAVLQEGDELNVDPDGEVVLEFGDGTRVTVEETTQLKIASFFVEGGIVRTELLLKVGQIAARVNKVETTRSDFRIKSPTATTSRRGTDFTAFHDPGSKTSLWSVREGVIFVKPNRGRAKTVRAGQEVESTARGVGPVAKLGRAGAPKGGLNRAAALARVGRLLARADESCGFEVTSYGLKRTPKGWAVTVRLAGRTSGKAGFKVVGKRASPSNRLGRRVARRCS